MYNESSRAALFSALGDRVEFQGYKPIFRCFYSKPARIFLVRTDGELTLPVSAQSPRHDKYACLATPDGCKHQARK